MQVGEGGVLAGRRGEGWRGSRARSTRMLGGGEKVAAKTRGDKAAVGGW